MRLSSRVGVAIAATVVSVLVAAGGVEGWRRGVEAGGNLVIPTDEPELQYAYRPGGTENSWGFREREVPREKPAGVRRVAVLGDSVTLGSGVTAEQAYPRVLESLLHDAGVADVEVLNFGVVGYDIQQVAAVLRARVLAFQPDLVVYGAYTNDLVPTEAIAMGPGLDALYVRYPVAPEMRLLPGALDDWLRPRSATFRWLQGRHAARIVAARGGSLPADWDFFQHHVTHLRAEARAAGVPLLVFGIPPHVLADPVLARCSANAARFGRAFCEDSATIVATFEQIAGVLGLPWVDGITAYQADGLRDYYGDPEDPVHPNAAGHVALARALVGPVRDALGE